MRSARSEMVAVGGRSKVREVPWWEKERLMLSVMV